MSTAKHDMKVDLEWKKIVHILHFAYPNINADNINFLKQLTYDGTETASNIFEIAIAKCGNLHHEPTDGRDYSDGSDAKLSAVRLRGRGSTIYSARIDSKNKFGYLRIGVYERIHDKMYYFLVPPEIHTNYRSLEIKFDSNNHEPQRHSKGVNWWEYEVSSIHEVSKPVNNFQSSNLPNIKVPVLTRYTVLTEQERIAKREEILQSLFDWN